MQDNILDKNMSFEKNFWEIDEEGAAERNELARSLGYEFRGGYFQGFFKTRDEFDFCSLVLRKTLDGYIQDPVLFVKCSGMNLFNFWFVGKRWKIALLNMLLHIPFILVALAGAYLLWKRNQMKQVEVVILFILYLYAVHVPVLAQARYSVPLVPFLAILPSIAIINFWRIRQQKADSLLHRLS